MPDIANPLRRYIERELAVLEYLRLAATENAEVIRLLREEVDRLTAEVEQLRAYTAAMEQGHVIKDAHFAEARAEVEALKHDNARLVATNAELATEQERLRVENEALRYLLNGIASPANIEAAIKHARVAVAPRRGD